MLITRTFARYPVAKLKFLCGYNGYTCCYNIGFLSLRCYINILDTILLCRPANANMIGLFVYERFDVRAVGVFCALRVVGVFRALGAIALHVCLAGFYVLDKRRCVGCRCVIASHKRQSRSRRNNSGHEKRNDLFRIHAIYLQKEF